MAQDSETRTLANRLTTIKYAPYPPTERQAAFLLDFDLEALYGGAAGGGKSDALLMAALQFVDVPGYAALILRKTFRDLALPGALMDRAKLWLDPTDAYWAGGENAWVFPSGARLSFGYLEHEKQKYRYQSSEFQFIAFDELTQFKESQYRYLFTRLRRPQGLSKGPLARVPLRMRTASNPGGVGHDWVRRRFIDEKQKHPRRRFYPARLYDNPYVDQVEYEQALGMLDPLTRKQMLEGDWSARSSGGYFDRRWFTGRQMDTVPPKQMVRRRVRYWDLASGEEDPLTGSDPDWTSGCLMSLLTSGEVVVENIRRFRKAPAGVEQEVAAAAHADPRGTEVWFEQEPGSSGKSLISYYRRVVLPQFAVRADPKSGDKVTRATPVSARAASGDVWLIRGDWQSDFFDEAETFPDGAHDDMVDSVSGAYHVLVRSRNVAGTPRPQGDTEPSAWRV